MWHRIANFVLKFRLPLLVLLLAATAYMGWRAKDVTLSYEFTNAIPTDHPKYQEYQNFRKTFGEDGTTLFMAVQTPRFFDNEVFWQYVSCIRTMQKVPGVLNVLSVPTAISLEKDTVTDRLTARQVLSATATSDSTGSGNIREDFSNLPFYRGLLWNPDSNVYIAAVRIDPTVMASKGREGLVKAITDAGATFSKATGVPVHYSGLPFIRTRMAAGVQREMRLFLILSFVLTAFILAIFFRSLSAVVASMIVVATGVIWSVGTLVLFGYKITLLTALIPPLIVVIGIPNCIYLLNQYHLQYRAIGEKRQALVETVARMGVVTLLTNLTAAIGFGVFYVTKSAILKEFGLVAGLNILGVFVISLLFIPIFFSFLKAPQERHTRYLDNSRMGAMLDRIIRWVFAHRKTVFAISILATAIGIAGALRLRSEAHIVDDLPRKDPIYTDLKFFERQVRGIMPLEIVIDAKRKNGAVALGTLNKLDSLDAFLRTLPEAGQPLSIINGVKFARQAYYDGDSASYGIPNMFDGAFLQPYLRARKGDTSTGAASFNTLVRSFVDSTRQRARLSVSIADIGSVRLPALVARIRPEAERLFPAPDYSVAVTGTSIVFLEGSGFIISSLRDSLLLALLMILVCIAVLVRSVRITIVAVIVNAVPLLITAGVMGWVGVPLKPSTVLVFSVALGITVDVTIRFLVSYRRERALYPVEEAVSRTLRETGLSIIYTSLVLAAGFGVFAVSQFDGTRSLGLLTGGTLLLAMAANLVLQPALLLWGSKKKA
jgi:hypothetical protein